MSPHTGKQHVEVLVQMFLAPSLVKEWKGEGLRGEERGEDGLMGRRRMEIRWVEWEGEKSWFRLLSCVSTAVDCPFIALP